MSAPCPSPVLFNPHSFSIGNNCSMFSFPPEDKSNFHCTFINGSQLWQHTELLFEIFKMSQYAGPSHKDFGLISLCVGQERNIYPTSTAHSSPQQEMVIKSPNAGAASGKDNILISLVSDGHSQRKRTQEIGRKKEML